jgi:hypothetical protein
MSVTPYVILTLLFAMTGAQFRYYFVSVDSSVVLNNLIQASMCTYFKPLKTNGKYVDLPAALTKGNSEFFIRGCYMILV